VSEDSEHGDAVEPVVEGDHGPGGADASSGTGDGAVERVLSSLERLDDLPVSEHVAVFEAAHEALRAALADAGRRETASTGR
jgi:hypothetical protein